MRLAIALAGACLLHGVVLGFGLALLPREARPASAVAVLDVDVVPARPDPVAVTAPQPGEPSQPAAPSHPARHLRRPPSAPAFRPPAPGPAPADPTSAPAPAAPAAAPAADATAVTRPEPPGPARVTSLSAQPRYRTNPAPSYPVAARRLREQGVVLVRVAVTADGLPTAVSVERGCGHPLLDEAAVEAVRRWTFEPARAAGTPVASLVVVPVRFALSDAR